MTISKKDEIKTGVLLSYALIGINSLVGILYTPILLKMLGHSDYALYSLSANIIGFLTFLDFGLSNGLVRFITTFRISDNINSQHSLYGLFLCVFVVISFFILGGGYLIYENLYKFYGASMTIDELGKVKLIMAIMLITMAISFPFNLFGSILIAHERFIFLRSVIAIRVILNALIMVIFLKLGYGVISLVIITSIFNFAVVLINCVYCFFIIKIKIKFNNFDFYLLREIFKFSFLLFTVVIFEKLIWSSSQIILGMYVSTAVLAVFSIAFQLQQIYVSFSTAFSGVFLPRVTKMFIANESNESISNLFIQSGRFQFIIISIVFSGFIIFGKYFILFWAGKEFLEAFFVTGIFFVPLTLLSLQSLGIVILQARNKLKFISILYFFVTVCSLVMQAYFSKYFGIRGTAFAVLIPMIIGPVLILNIYYQKKLGIDIIKFWNEIMSMAKIPFVFAVLIKIIMIPIIISSVSVLLIFILVYSILFFFILWKFCLNNYERNMLKELINPLIAKLNIV